MIKIIAAALAVFALGAAIALSQVIGFPPPAGISGLACVYNSSPVTLTNGQIGVVQCSDNLGHVGGITGSVSVSGSPGVPGEFQPNGNITAQMAVGTSSTNAALPAGGGLTVRISNVGTNPAYVHLGGPAVTATIADQLVAPASVVDLTVGTNTFIAAITSTLTTTLNMAGGIGPNANLGTLVLDQIATGAKLSSGSLSVVPSTDTDICAGALAANKKNAPFGTAGATNVQVVAPVAAQKVYVCELDLMGAAAHYNIIEGTGAACTTANEFAIRGSTTAANGLPVPASGGWQAGNGNGTVFQTSTAGNGICILTDASVQYGGGFTFVQQ